jgi:hypothetical protein
MLHGWMSQEKTFQEKPANRQRDRTGIVKIRKHIADAQDELKELGIDGRKVVRSIAAPLADIVSGDWLRYHFPGDAPSRRTHMTRWIPRDSRDPDREQRDWEKRSNYDFIRYRAPETLLALLQDLHSALASALTLIESDPRARGGRQSLAYRDNALLNLVNIWHQIGKTPVGTRDSFFSVFCHYIFRVWGWPTDGLDRAIPNAIKNYRNLQKNPARLRK